MCWNFGDGGLLGVRFGLSVEFVVGGDITFDGGGDFFKR